MTMPNICIYICEQQRVHKRSQRNMRLNLATVDIFRIFTVSGQISTVINKGYMSNLLELTAKHKTLRTIVFDMLDSTVITPETADDLLNAISNSPSKNIY